MPGDTAWLRRLCCGAGARAGAGAGGGCPPQHGGVGPACWAAPASPGVGKLPGRDGRSCLGGTGVICKLDLELD